MFFVFFQIQFSKHCVMLRSCMLTEIYHKTFRPYEEFLLQHSFWSQPPQDQEATDSNSSVISAWGNNGTYYHASFLFATDRSNPATAGIYLTLHVVLVEKRSEVIQLSLIWSTLLTEHLCPEPSSSCPAAGKVPHTDLRGCTLICWGALQSTLPGA